MTKPTPTPADTLYWRQFVRSSEPDQDWPIDPTWVAAHISENDHFGNFLLKSTTADILTFNQVVTPFYENWVNKISSFNVHCVADGGFMKYNSANDAWFDPHVRFVCVAYPETQVFESTDWAVFIVGSWETDSETRFVQAASWDGVKFNYYGREMLNPASGPNPSNGLIGWVYQGSSFDAFDETTSYLGPFNGHVNGATIMKELRKPWLHWQSSSNSSLSQCFSEEVMTQLQKSTFISGGGSGINVLGNVTLADILESTVETGVGKWMQSRKVTDFWTNGSLALSVNIQRWIAHVLLTTTVNILCAQPIQSTQLQVPSDFFINIAPLGSLANGIPSQAVIAVPDYQKAVAALQLSMIQEIGPADDPKSMTIYSNLPPDQRVTLYQGSLGGGKQTDEHNLTLYAIAQQGEGFGPFTCLIASLEDNQGLAWLQNGIAGKVSVLTQQTLQCLLMIDPWNPVYSWRRGVLMQYCPAMTSLNGKTYDVDSVMVTSIMNSSFVTQADSPEYTFAQLYNNYNPNAMQQTISNYWSAVEKRIKQTPTQAVADWMLLAESRRRIYRPLPLDEFGFTLPFALKYPGAMDLMPMEMQANATIAPIPQRGLQFLSDWTGTLWTDNPIILPTFKTSSKVTSVMNKSIAPTAAWTLPGKGKALASCEGSVDPARPRACPARSSRLRKTARTARTCPGKILSNSASMTRKQVNGTVASATPNGTSLTAKPLVVAAPLWSDILNLLQAPFWVANSQVVGKGWREAMLYYGNYGAGQKSFDLWDETIVKDHIKTIYDHLRGRSMPITSNPEEFWPDNALEMLRSWANQGFRVNQSDPVTPQVIIPVPSDPRPVYRIRKDIRSLTEAEINTFRAKLDDVLGCTVLNSKWQELCRLHGEWCLHYQEAFSFWHRAYLRYVEDMIDFAIPYWNGCDPECADPSSPAAGIPQPFLDLTYQHPVSGETRPNPLRFALALDGISTGGGPIITRDATLVENDRTSDDFKTKVAFWQLYQSQYLNSLSQTLFSYPQNVTTGAGSPFGIPWANPLQFSQQQPDDLYIYSNQVFPYTPNFDGFFEQVHDNGHGWVGGTNGDMSDNGRTAADPMFLVYHANLDRILDAYLSTHPQAMYTANYPLRPFRNNASSLDYDDPRTYMFTTLGDMAKDTRSIGYIYAPPFVNNGNDMVTEYIVAHGGRQKPQVSGGTAIVAHSTETSLSNGISKTPVSTTPDQGLKILYQPMISFPNIKCTSDSYTIDLFSKDAKSLQADPIKNKDYLGRLTRLGMGAGNEDNASSNSFKRCRRSPITRSVLLGTASSNLGTYKALVEKLSKNGFQQVVTNLSMGKDVPQSEWKNMEGFTGYFGIGYQPVA